MIVSFPNAGVRAGVVVRCGEAAQLRAAQLPLEKGGVVVRVRVLCHGRKTSVLT